MIISYIPLCETQVNRAGFDPQGDIQGIPHYALLRTPLGAVLSVHPTTLGALSVPIQRRLCLSIQVTRSRAYLPHVV